MGGGIHSKLNDYQNPVVAVTTKNPKEDVDFIPYSLQAPPRKLEKVYQEDHMAPYGDYIKYSKLNPRKTKAISSISKTFFEDYSIA
jgi:hypothetical protein